jgi:hypothetical protein
MRDPTTIVQDLPARSSRGTYLPHVVLQYLEETTVVPNHDTRQGGSSSINGLGLRLCQGIAALPAQARHLAC